MRLRYTALVALLIVAGPVLAQTEAKLTDPNGMGGFPGDFFGRTVALSGDGTVALVGAENKLNLQGAAFIYVQENGTWRLQAELRAPAPAVIDYFGAAVALTRDGTLAFVTSRSFTNPAVHVFERTGDDFAPVYYLMALSTVSFIATGRAAPGLVSMSCFVAPRSMRWYCGKRSLLRSPGTRSAVFEGFSGSGTGGV